MVRSVSIKYLPSRIRLGAACAAAHELTPQGAAPEFFSGWVTALAVATWTQLSKHANSARLRARTVILR